MTERRRNNENWLDRSSNRQMTSFGPRRGATPWRGQRTPSLSAGPTKVKCMDVLRLEKISKLPPLEASTTLLAEKDALLNHVKGNILPDFLSLLYEVLSNIVSSPSDTSVVQILVALAGDNFFKATAEYILDLPLEEGAKKISNARFWANYDGFFLSVATTLNALLVLAPITGADMLPPLIKAIVYSLANFERRHELRFDPKVHAAFETLSLDLNQIMEQYRIEEETKTQRKLEPPDNFRDIDVYPLAWEVNSRARTFLRKNIIKGPYDSIEHYLDVQFRLIREDFVAPLRDGVCEYLEGTTQKLSNIKIHHNVSCVGVVLHQGEMGFLLQVFKPRSRSFGNSETSRRFMYGSLVCLSEDNFKRILFGRIIDSEHLSAGRLVVSMADKNDLVHNKLYTLAECSVYFEPYYHVLNALQTIRVLPMEKYLVRICADIVDDISGKSVSTLIKEGSQIGLNVSQQEAYAMALSKEFSIIQGPPGTGKTHLSLHVTRQLIRENPRTGPILIICFTNHALDQFLAGLLDTTTKLIRVGGQSKNEALQDYIFKKVKEETLAPYKEIIYRKNKKNKYTFDYEYNEDDEFHEYDNMNTLNICKLLNGKRSLNRDILGYAKTALETEAGVMRMINQFQHIIDFKFFKNVEVDPNYRHSWFAYASRDELLDWLLYQSPTDQEQNSNLLSNDEILFFQEEHTSVKTKYVLRDADDPRYAHLRWDHELDQRKEAFVFGSSNQYFFCVKKILQILRKNQLILNSKENQPFANEEEYFHYLEQYEETAMLQSDCHYVMKQLLKIRDLKKVPNISDIPVNYGNPHAMSTKDRWLLYRAWLQRLVPVQEKSLLESRNEFQKHYEKNLKLTEKLDRHVFQTADVIGMTTTSAARLHNTLQKLGCQIVIVEEAAEVLEAHIVTALTPACRKLILVGDHKQLRPSTSDYKTTREYNLGVSLFERMVANGVRCYTLDEQHRMRPEIASLITPAIYPILTNADAVQHYPGVRGFSKSLYFITHQHREITTGDSSKKNVFEAEYLMRLARHLVLNGYAAERITMIAAYSGQWSEMTRIKREMVYPMLNQMRVCVLDNFQGEENDIILLSLVRNNEEGVNGFLNLENRVCVALSRARHGLYIMGNMPQLVKGSAIWKKVSEVLQNNESLGEFITVHCVNHPRTTTEIREITDFDKVPFGGCQVPCNSHVLECGHECKCKLECHISTKEKYTCKEPCTKVLCDHGHVCPDRCYVICKNCIVPKQCKLPCGHEETLPCYQLPNKYVCNAKVQVKLDCGHEADKACHISMNDFKCPHPCTGPPLKCGHDCNLQCHVADDPEHLVKKCMVKCKKNLACGHDCNKSCFESCEPCSLMVTKTITECGHQLLWECGKDVQKLDCISRCGKQLACGHECIQKCAEHENCHPCIVQEEHELNCGHKKTLKCHETVDMIYPDMICEVRCRKKLLCGHECTKKCFEKCDPCAVKVLKKIDECGHERSWECGLQVLKRNCSSRKCGKVLPCGHQCRKTCARDCNPCRLKVMRELDCGHIQLMECNVNAKIECKCPCQKKLTCGHGCPKRCFEACGGCCTVMVRKVVEECGHEIMWECGRPATPMNCKELVKFESALLCCGHKDILVPCCYIKKPKKHLGLFFTPKCATILDCGHQCTGTCGECKQGCSHVLCKECQ